MIKVLVENLAKVLDTKGAWVAEYVNDISGTPCEPTVEDKGLNTDMKPIFHILPLVNMGSCSARRDNVSSTAPIVA